MPNPFRFPWRSRDAIDRDLDAELQFHLDARVAELEKEGLDAAAARARAVEEFGDLEFTRKYCRDLDRRTERSIRLADRVAAWGQDLRFAARTLRKNPGFALISIVTLALAIGANTAIFSVARAVLLKPLGFGEPGALVKLSESPAENPERRWELSPPNFVDYEAQQRSFASLGGYLWQATTWQSPEGPPSVVNGIAVTADLFDVLQVRALRGRTFRPGEDAPGAPGTVVLGYRFWEREVGADSSIIGRKVLVGGTPHEVIGIMPRGFTVAGREDLWIPLDLSEFLANAPVTRKQHFVHGIGRLRPGVSLESARADILTIGRRLQQEYPEANARYLGALDPLHESMVGELQRPVLLLLGAAGLVLLIASANLANVTLSRTLGRREEIAIRAALGAGRARLARQLLTESTVVALIGGGIGVGLATVGTRALLALNPDALPPRFEVGVDGGVLLFSLLLSVGTGILFGLAPALGATRTDLQSSLKERGRTGSGGRAGERTRRALVVAQVGLAVVLLVGAGLLIRSFREITQVRPGFDPAGVLTAQLRVEGARYDSAWAVNRVYEDILGGIARGPGVLAAGAGSHVPTEGGWGTALVVEGSAVDPSHPIDVRHAIVRGGYFEALRIPVVAGRLFDGTDLPDGPPVALVNEALARAHLPGGVAVGRRVRIGPNPKANWLTVVGVVGDVRDARLDRPAEPTIYLDGRQQAWMRTMSLVVRTAGDPMTAAPVIRAAIKGADPTLAIRAARSLDQLLTASLGPRRFGLGIATAFAGLALLLAAVGIYGVLAFSVTSRTREFGVRLALGAPPRTLLAMVLKEGLGWAAVGVVLGVGGAILIGRLLGSMLYGVRPVDPVTYAAVAIGLLAVATVACLVPARRATSVDPLTSTRAD